MTNDERLAYLLESVFVPTNASITIGTIRDEAGLTAEQYGLVRSTLENAIATLKASDDTATRLRGLDLQDALTAMLSRGISFSDANRQATIDLLAQFGQWPTEVCNAVKALGGASKPRWKTLGYEVAPTLESVALAATKKQLEDSAIDALQAFREALASWDGSGDAPVLGGG